MFPFFEALVAFLQRQCLKLVCEPPVLVLHKPQNLQLLKTAIYDKNQELPVDERHELFTDLQNLLLRHRLSWRPRPSPLKQQCCAAELEEKSYEE